MKAGDVMSQEVISVSPDAGIAQAAGLMLKERISGLPVIDAAHALVGIVTEGDLLRRVETATEKTRPHWLEILLGSSTAAREYVRSHGRLVSEVMTPDVAVVDEDTSLVDVVDVMERRRVKRLPVVRNGRVVGIITRANLLHALAATPPAKPTAPDDRRIREQLERELSTRSWNAIQGHIVVNGGVVDIWGVITDERHRTAIHVAAENIPGVREIRDHLVWVDPYSGLTLGTGLDSKPI